jgi:hypothetical protein
MPLKIHEIERAITRDQFARLFDHLQAAHDQFTINSIDQVCFSQPILTMLSLRHTITRI